MNNLYGLVMCGGQSSRMGRDKGLIQTSKMSWMEKACSLLGSLELNEIYISINQEQEKDYSFVDHKCIIDEQYVKGPLNGLLTAHAHHPKKDFFILACDMQLMTVDTLLPLQVSYNKHHLHCEAYAYKKQGNIEPLCGIYSHTVLAKVMKKVKTGTLESYSLKYLLENNNTYFLDTDKENPFYNMNTEAEIIQFS